MWNAAADELVPETARTCRPRRSSTTLGYRYELDIFTPAEHLTLAINDQYAPAAEFLGTAKVDRNPAHVTYVVNPSLDHADLGFVADHAYWLSGVRLRDAGGKAPRARSTRSRTPSAARPARLPDAVRRRGRWPPATSARSPTPAQPDLGRPGAGRRATR